MGWDEGSQIIFIQYFLEIVSRLLAVLFVNISQIFDEIRIKQLGSFCTDPRFPLLLVGLFLFLFLSPVLSFNVFYHEFTFLGKGNKVWRLLALKAGVVLVNPVKSHS